MKFYAHKTIATGGYLAFGGHIAGLIPIFIGSILPDLLDKNIALGSHQLYHNIHRKLFHWWALYFVFAFSIWYEGLNTAVDHFLFLITAGALIHIGCDSITKSGVPLLNPFRPGYGIRLLKTGEMPEYIIGTVVMMIGIYIRMMSK